MKDYKEKLSRMADKDVKSMYDKKFDSKKRGLFKKMLKKKMNKKRGM